MKIEKVYGNEIPPKFEYLRGGVFINALPEKVESEDSDLYSYHQTFTMETNEEILEKKYIRLVCEVYKAYLNETSWIWDKYQRNCVTLRNISEDGFNEVYKEIIEKQEFARNEIKRIETQLGLTPEISLDMAKQEKISELKIKRDFIIDSTIENVQVKKSTDRENIQGTIQYFEVLSQGNSTIGWTMEDNSVKELSKDDLQRILDSYVVRKAQAFAEYQYNKQQVDECITIEEVESLVN